MTRVKRGISHVKRRRRLKKAAKGFQWGRKNLLKLAKIAVVKAGAYSYVGRKQKKRDFRANWNIVINAALRQNGLTYSKFMGTLKKAHVELDRKILADIAEHHPQIWKKVLEAVK